MPSLKSSQPSLESKVAEAGQQLTTRDATEQGNPQQMFVPHLVAEQAKLYPEKMAVIGYKEAIKYSELDERASHIARNLRSHGVSRNTLVAICLERSPNFVAAALGVLKAGGAYVPLDPAYPPDRIAWMLNDAQPRVVLTRGSLNKRVAGGKWVTLNLDGFKPQIDSRSAESIECVVEPKDLAYVIYTSGSTGRPKGVQIRHDNLSNLVSWHQEAFGVTASDRASQLASPGFDAAVWELWPYLTAGATVYVPDDAMRSDSESLRDWLVSSAITIAFVPTPVAERMIKLEWPEETRLRFLLTGADTLRSYAPPNLPFELVNNYGPTECTVVTTSGIVPVNGSHDTLPSIGRPISNVQVHILSEQLQQVPLGITGEIYIGGAGVGEGYVNAVELTSEKFITSPFQPNACERLYRTGDLGRYLPDGQIAFLGRIDEQIKIRGHRIEPNEIVAALLKYSMVQASAVIVREDASGDKQLVGYVVPSPGTEPTHKGLHEFLSRQLPEYMVPAVFVRISSIPVNASGKLDRALLPVPDESNALINDTYVPPRTAVERRMTEIVAPLLGLEKISVEDNFFMLGGHSLLGTQLIARTRQVFGVELNLRTLFGSPSIAALSEKVEEHLYARLQAMSEAEAQQLLRDGDLRANRG